VTTATGTIAVPARTTLLGAYPNPFNPRTNLRFRLREAQRVRIEVVDLRGRRVDVVFDGVLGRGEHAVPWDGSGGSSGVYFARLETEDGVFHRRIALLK
jgi:hypothetical protein